MAQVSNQAELLAALAVRDPLIEIIMNFNISTQITVDYTVTIQSPGGGAAFTLTRDAAYIGPIFSVLGRGDLTINNLILDGNRANITPSAANPVSALLSDSGNLTISNSYVQNSAAYTNGGAIFVDSGACLFVMDSIISGNSSMANGGGIYVSAGTKVAITGSTVSNNEAVNGAGIYLDRCGELTFTDGMIFSNTATGDGGGIYLGTGACATVSNSSININSAANGAGVFVYYYAQYIGVSTELLSNAATGNGGGIAIIGGRAVLIDCPVIENTAQNGAGAFVDACGALFIISQNTISPEIADNSASGYGGAIFMQGGATVRIDGPAYIHGNTAGVLANGIYDAACLVLSGDITLPDGIYMTLDANPIAIAGPLNGSTIVLVNSPYLNPSPGRFLIIIANGTCEYPCLSEADNHAFIIPAAGFEDWEIRRSCKDSQLILIPLGTFVIRYENLLGAENPNPMFYTSESDTIVLESPSTVPGCRFVGWFLPERYPRQVRVIPQGSSGDIVLCAKWCYCR